MKEMQRYHLDILGISECRLNRLGKVKTLTGEIVYSDREDEHHSNGVVI